MSKNSKLKKEQKIEKKKNVPIEIVEKPKKEKVAKIVKEIEKPKQIVKEIKDTSKPESSLKQKIVQKIQKADTKIEKKPVIEKIAEKLVDKIIEKDPEKHILKKDTKAVLKHIETISQEKPAIKDEPKIEEKILDANREVSKILEITNQVKPELELEEIELEYKPEKPKKSDSEKKDVQISLNKKIVPEKQDELSDEKNKVEALLFACGKYLDEEIISQLCEIDTRKLRKILDALRTDYENRDSSLMIFQEDKSWKINVREKYLSIVRKIVSDTELTKSLMETLAVIAWKSPVYQSVVVNIRGNKCYDHIEELENQGFITKDKKGRSYILKTTDKFYTYFEIEHGNLKSLLSETKIPLEQGPIDGQTTLVGGLQVVDIAPVVDNRTPEQIKEDNRNKFLGQLEVIEIKKKTESDEDKHNQHEFLKKMDEQISESRARNEALVQEFPGLEKPKPVAVQQAAISESNIIPSGEQHTQSAVVETSNAQQTETTAVEGAVAANPTLEDPKPKTLTKKQLEKKFKDELLRVREKMDKKKE